MDTSTLTINDSNLIHTRDSEAADFGNNNEDGQFSDTERALAAEMEKL